MISLGQMNRTQVQERTEGGWLLLADQDEREIYLPDSDAPKAIEAGQSLHVFVYHNSEGELAATTARPKAMVGQLVLLTAKHQTPYGVFFDWGLAKDLLVFKRDLPQPVEPGETCLVYVFIDEEGRIAGSAKYSKYVDLERHAYQDGEEVHLTIADETPLGYKAIVDYKFSALLYEDQIFRKVKKGDQIRGYIRQVREDGLLDVSTQKPGYGKVPELAEKIMEALTKGPGSLQISDKSSPEVIKNQFNCSKKAFKQALGSLKKQGLIEIEPQQIKLAKS